jgi:hypothetical protein
MSFDLAIWHSENSLTSEQAQQIYTKLCEEWPYLEGVNPNVDALYRELTEKWPELDTIPEERIGDFDFCPWSCALNRSGMALITSCVWPKAPDVAKHLLMLAEKHNLVLFDPQTATVVLPKNLRQKKLPWFRRPFNRNN